MSRHLLDALLRHAQARPGEIAICGIDASPRTWIQLVGEVQQAVDALESISSSQPGARIVYESRNSPAEVVLSLACVAIGAIEIPMDSRLPKQLREELLARSSGVFIDPSTLGCRGPAVDFANAFRELQKRAAQVDVDRPSLVLWTSGTTERPRGVMLSQRNLVSNAAAKLAAVPQSPHDVRLTLLSLAHAYARTCDMGTWLLSGCRWTLDFGTHALDRIDPNCLPTLINCVPILARRIMDRLDERAASLHRLRVLGCGGAALDAELYDRLTAHGIEVIQGYGCTETSPVICSSSPGATQAGRVGPPIAGCEIRIVDQRLFVRGPLVMVGYLDDPAATAAKIDADGWLDTGDLVEIESSGQLRIVGRADDVIVLENGFKVHPLAIEQWLMRECELDHVVILGIDQKIVIAVQRDPEIDHDLIRSLVQQRLPPRTPVAVERLHPPLTLSSGELTAKGSVRRHVVRGRFAREQPEPGQ